VTLRNYESLGKYVPHLLRIQIHALWFSYHSVEQTVHTVHQIYNNVIIFQLLHVSCLTGPSSWCAQLHKTIV
jgi:hypothetical protein